MHIFVQRHFLIPLGYQIDYHVKALVKLGISPNDAVTALSPSEGDETAQSRSERAFQELRELLNKLGIGNVHRALITINDPVTAISTIVNYAIRTIDKSQGEIIMCFSGGIRALGTYMLIAHLLLTRLLGVNSRFYVVAENIDDIIELTEFLNVLRLPDITEAELGILNYLTNVGRCTSAVDISEHVNKDLSTVNRQLNNLEEKGLVRARRGRTRCFETTNVGRLLYLSAMLRAGKQNLLNTQ